MNMVKIFLFSLRYSNLFFKHSRKNQDFLSKGGPFSAFIDFKGDSRKEKIMIDEQETAGHRKHSFTQFDGDFIEH